MKKITAAVMMICVFLFGGIQTDGSDVVSDALSDVALEAKHYYQTELDEADMVVKRVSKKEYRIYHTTESGKSYYVSLCLKDWGVWNLGDMSFTSKGVTKNIIGGSTDWEYVFMVYSPITGEGGFTGGNHGCENLLGMKLYDGVSGEEFELAVGEQKSVRRLVVVENTEVLYADTTGIPYMNVERRYTFVGTRVNLDTNFEFISDALMTRSYSAMACVNKSFGSRCTFDNAASVETKAGSHDDGFHGRVEAMECTLSGSDTAAALTVGIFNKSDMTDDFSNDDKVFLWDMADDYTKLYFSKYTTSDIVTVETGTKWSFAAYWEASIK
ncbi:MAG: hypothetical protein LUG52_07600 [Clostridia bacterium]|nr:hypothetical protein [Clostridia bacterium]